MDASYSTFALNFRGEIFFGLNSTPHLIPHSAEIWELSHLIPHPWYQRISPGEMLDPRSLSQIRGEKSNSNGVWGFSSV